MPRGSRGWCSPSIPRLLDSGRGARGPGHPLRGARRGVHRVGGRRRRAAARHRRLVVEPPRARLAGTRGSGASRVHSPGTAPSSGTTARAPACPTDGRIPARTLDEELATLEALVDEAAPGRISLFGASSGAGVASMYAARHPDRVERLVLYGALRPRRRPRSARRARGHARRSSTQHWGLGSRVLADLFLPDATADERAEFVEFQRRSASREVALACAPSGVRLRLHRAPAATCSPPRSCCTAATTAPSRSPSARTSRGASAMPASSRSRAIDHFPWRGDADAVVRETLGFLGVPLEAASAPRAGERGPAHGSRTGGAAARRARAHGCRDRGAARAVHPHGAPAHREHPHEARRSLAHRRGRVGAPQRGDLGPADAAGWPVPATPGWPDRAIPPPGHRRRLASRAARPRAAERRGKEPPMTDILTDTEHRDRHRTHASTRASTPAPSPRPPRSWRPPASASSPSSSSACSAPQRHCSPSNSGAASGCIAHSATTGR